MRIQNGDLVRHPATGQKGIVKDIHQNPACLIRGIVVQWEDGETEEIEELEFGPLED